jgi:hypothetical protein
VLLFFWKFSQLPEIRLWVPNIHLFAVGATSMHLTHKIKLACLPILATAFFPAEKRLKRIAKITKEIICTVFEHTGK